VILKGGGSVRLREAGVQLRNTTFNQGFSWLHSTILQHVDGLSIAPHLHASIVCMCWITAHQLLCYRRIPILIYSFLIFAFIPFIRVSWPTSNLGFLAVHSAQGTKHNECYCNILTSCPLDHPPDATTTLWDTFRTPPVWAFSHILAHELRPSYEDPRDPDEYSTPPDVAVSSPI
jgi:hypothetical protein